jgi:hypothetical protein
MIQNEIEGSLLLERLEEYVNRTLLITTSDTVYEGQLTEIIYHVIQAGSDEIGIPIALVLIEKNKRTIIGIINVISINVMKTK